MPIVLAPLLLPAAVFLAAIVLYALAQSSQGWADPTIKASKARNQNQLAAWLSAIPGVGFLSDRINSLVYQGVRFVRTHVSHWAEAHLRPVTAWFGALNQLAFGLFVGIGALAGDVADEFERLLNIDLPHVLRRAEAFARHGIDALAHDLQRSLARLRGYAVGIDRLARHTILPQLHRLTRTVEHAIPRELAGIRTRLGALDRRIPRGLTHRLTRLEKLLGAAALAAVVVRTLARRFPWLFCRKVNALGRRLCGLDDSLLAGLLEDTLLIAGIVSVVEFTQSLQTIEDEALKLLGGFIEEMPSP